MFESLNIWAFQTFFLWIDTPRKKSIAIGAIDCLGLTTTLIIPSWPFLDFRPSVFAIFHKKFVAHLLLLPFLQENI
ncbi:MAG: hypothetical protein BEV12_11270 [Microcystis aeruginosa CACIAM 03]|nr:MAG: hypothetical protein BEV12_11270 [Microcystis aeruginosa CACIAM 03]